MLCASVHDVADQTAHSTHMVQFEYEDAVDSRVIIGVYGSPYQVSQSTATHFELVGKLISPCPIILSFFFVNLCFKLGPLLSNVKLTEYLWLNKYSVFQYFVFIEHYYYVHFSKLLYGINTQIISKSWWRSFQL